MIWQLYALLFGFAVLMLFQALQRASSISAVIAVGSWAYLALVSGSVQVVTQNGAEVNFGYRSLAIFCLLVAIASILVAIWAFSEEAERTVSEHSDGYSVGGQ